MALTKPDPKWPHAEDIGNELCPIMRRWTLAGYRADDDPERNRNFRLYLHHFFRRADDRDVHDHPNAFFTFCFFGSYEDMAPCRFCDGTGRRISLDGYTRREADDGIVYWMGSMANPSPLYRRCERCDGDGVIVNDRLRFGSFRYRPAEHTHRTRSGRFGAWTLVLMLPKSRSWGFWRDGKWWGAAEYEDEYGPAMRCE